MDALLRRRQMMLAGGTPPAPLPYTPVEYIVTDGNCYILPGGGFAATPPKSCEMKVKMPTSFTQSTVFSLLAGYLVASGSNAKAFALARYYNKTIAFTMGEYEFEDLVALSGGEVIKDNETTVGWASSSAPQLYYNAVIAQTKTDNFIIFSNAGIIAKTNAAEQNLGLGVTAVAMDSDTAGVAAEYRFKGDGITIA